MKENILLFDIGGTKTRVATSDGSQILGDPIIFETPQDFQIGIETIKSAKERLIGTNSIQRAFGSVSGPFDEGHAKLVNSPNLPLWVNKPLKKALEEALEAPVRLENDASLAGLGEANFGAGRGHHIVAYLTVSTGIGGARIVDGQLDKSTFGFEPGYQIINFQDEATFAVDILSGKSLEKKFHKKAREIEDNSLWNELAEKLAYVVNNTIVFWSPDVVVLGGSMILGEPAIDVEETEKGLEKVMKIFPKYSKIKKAELGDLSGLYGALTLSKE
ncbi:MAG: ROK family protein [Parcubacteria group bacterium]